MKREKVKKKKSAKKLDGDDDSELEEGSGKEVKRTGGFHVSRHLLGHLHTNRSESYADIIMRTETDAPLTPAR